MPPSTTLLRQHRLVKQTEPASEATAADDQMIALVCERYGTADALKFKTIPRPAPGRDELLVRVRASTITSGDLRVRSMNMPRGFRTLGRLALGWHGPRNKVLGVEFSGVVHAIGDRAKGFAAGDAVFGISGFQMGSHAEYLCISAEGAVAHKPENLTFEGAAALSFGGTTALTFLRRARLAEGETILINGASGNVGMAAVQLAGVMGGKVTGVCSVRHLDRVRGLGAQQVINYQKQDFTRLGTRFDVVFDVACNQSVERCLSVLNPGGRLIRLQADLPEICATMSQPRRRGRRLIVGSADERSQDLMHLACLTRRGRLLPVIAAMFPFSEAIDAHRFSDGPSRGGSVVIKMTDRQSSGLDRRLQDRRSMVD